MSKFYKVLCVFAIALVIGMVSCSKDDDGGSVALRDYDEQYIKDLDTIDEFIDNYYMTVSPDYDVTFTKITAQTPGTSIRNQINYPLQFKTVHVDEHGANGIDYKVYYINLREGGSQNPTHVDSVYMAYKGVLIDNDVFDQAQNPTWLPLYSTIEGFQEIIPLFKTGFISSGGGPDPVTFSDFGAGVMFVPSGLGYYAQSRSGIPSYSSLIFNFKLYELNYVDHDRDGVLSKDEASAEFPDPIDLDTDDDGTVNMLDIDDDGDGIMTKHEIHKDGAGNIIFEDCDNDGIPNYLDADSNGQTCN
jgi:FKBP-type peptidyl-prolyl cis-trans isomerase FkpA